MPQFTRDELATLWHYVKAHIEYLQEPPDSDWEIRDLLPLFFKLERLLATEATKGKKQ